ncbi:MAG: DUF3857 domain-containing protein [Planctomycetota bacterium]
MRAFLLWASTLLLGATALPQSKLTDAEVAAFEAKSRGDYATAIEGFLGIATATPKGDPDAEARAVFAIALARLCAERIGASDLVPRLLALAEESGSRAQPELRDRLLGTALDFAAERGDLPTVLRIQRDLGVVCAFRFAGPFDNERGAAFARELAAEKSFDPDATFEGKRHALRWRTLPVAEAPRGILDLGALMEPQEQVAGVLATALVAEQDCDVVLWLGCDGGFKVTLNGARVADGDARRNFARDQDRIALRLHAGANLLVLTALVQQGPLRLCARLRMIDGAPLRGVRAIDARDDLVAAAASKPRDGRIELQPRALERLLAAAQAGAGDAFLRAAVLLLLDHPYDPSAHRDREFADLAVASLAPPQDRIALAVQAATLYQVAAAEEKDDNARRDAYQHLLELDANQAEVCRNLAELELRSSGLAARAIELANQALAVNPGYAAARLVLADALAQQGLDDLAQREILAAIRPDAQGRVAPEAQARAVEVLRRQSRLKDAAQVAAELCKSSLDPRSALADAHLRARLGDDPAALATLRRATDLFPFDRALRREVALLLEEQDDFDGAALALRECIGICPDDDAAFVELARLAGRRGDVDQQRELLRAALELNPNRKQEARLLEFLEADQVPFHRTYELDADQVIAAAGTPPADAAEAGDSHFWILRQTVVRAYHNGTRSTYEHQIVRLLGERAVQQFTQWYVPHDNEEQRARILSLRIVKADGRELRPSLSGAFTRLPPLAIGDLIDVRSRVDDTAPTFFGAYFGLMHSMTPSDGQPCARSELVLLLDPGRDYRFQNRGGAPAAESSKDPAGVLVERFAMRDLPRHVAEDRAPGWRETAPLVCVTTWSDWDAFAAWWWNLVKRESEVTPAIRTKVAELIAGANTDAERIRAIYRFVTTDVRYKAWEFGVHGYKPYDVGTIYERRHGDCKDKALLLDAMLGVAGIEAWPVLIRGEEHRDTDDLTLPMVEQFNHCISYLPAQGDRPAMFLDGTATLFPTDTVPDMDQGAKVLVVHGPRAELVDIPYVAAADNLESTDVTIDIAADGSGHAVFVTTPTRNIAVPLREFLANEPARRTENVQRLLSRWFGKIEVRDLKCSDPGDIGTPIRLEVSFDGADLATQQGEELGLRAAPTAEPLQTLTSSITRTLPLLLGTPSSEHMQLTYRLPPGFHAVDVPQPVEMKETFGSYSLRWSVHGTALSVERTRSIEVPRIEPAEYPRFREFAAHVDAADGRTVTIRREER